MHVNDIIWIVIEDTKEKTELVTNVLAKCKPVTSVHLFAKTPESPTVPKGGKQKERAKGIVQRNAGLKWIRTNCTIKEGNCRGVVYMMDDDNKYDLQLFQEVGG